MRRIARTETMRVCKSTRRLPVSLRPPKTRRPSAPYKTRDTRERDGDLHEPTMPRTIGALGGARRWSTKRKMRARGLALLARSCTYKRPRHRSCIAVIVAEVARQTRRHMSAYVGRAHRRARIEWRYMYLGCGTRFNGQHGAYECARGARNALRTRTTHR